MFSKLQHARNYIANSYSEFDKMEGFGNFGSVFNLYFN